ncbi:hypothetical protein [Meiothermus ruber]|uniref:Uncharacterized protein n=1 Tax=Meiothermus ruber (strain ATCC 35948 / DSM 1279 / VKM B-1258 / 21) TaxID=504728 RepID=D3PQK6_MEIRD|nr:hypothetical protein [Meiothermus ruber]ADD27739.1 hypothetical protein Mrub_0974 [Meiothermus ruber DSM 1279]AGK04204.1 hypothetical protein K649_04510 [Meiothermus ruber DSM 1279]MCL6530677.1 hypothetical protein [Meiothermus ruber]GAO74667.1 putative uncharacterized protein [Meiothermus ruber H328]
MRGFLPRLLAPDRLARTLIYAGIAGFIWFFFLQPSPFGTTLSVTTLVGAGLVQYGSGKPFVIPLYVYVLAALILVQLAGLALGVGGQVGAALLGGALGLGLPYLAYRLQEKA